MSNRTTHLIAAVGVILLTAVAGIAAQKPPDTITEQQAIEIASEHIRLEVKAGSIPEWVGAVAGNPIPYYGMDNTIAAYAIPVLRQGTDIGYIMVENASVEHPVIEYSLSSLPYSDALSVATQLAREWGLTVDTEHPLYLGPFNHYFTLVDQAGLLDLEADEQPDFRVLLNMVDLSFVALDSNGQMIPSPPGHAPLTIPPHLTPSCDGDVISTDADSDPPYHDHTSEPTAKVVLQVPSYSQFCYKGCYVGCSPTAGGTLMGYWADKGYQNLMPSGDYQGTIKRLRDLAGVWCCLGGTVCGNPGWGCAYWDRLPGAMRTFANERGYSGADSSHITNPSFSRYRSEIDSSRPVVVNFNGYDGGGWNGANHATTGVGYDTAGGEYLIVNPNIQGRGLVYVRYGGSDYDSMSVDTFVPPPMPDTSPPSTTFNIPDANGDNGWYRSNVQVTLSASDNSGGSGVKLTQYKVDSGDWQTYSGPFTVSGDGVHVVWCRSQDNAGNWEVEHSITVKIDRTAPSGSLSLDGGATSTPGVLVRVDAPASDTTSGLWRVRFRDAGGAWEDWQPYRSVTHWKLPSVTGQTHGVEVQFKDYAGNESAVYQDTIRLDVYPARPSSAGYRLVKSTWGVAGWDHRSASYRVLGTAGQPSAVDVFTGAGYVLRSGYWGVEYEGHAVYLPLVLQGG